MTKQKKKRSAARRGSTAAASLPTKEQILEFVEDTPNYVGKREIARAFGVRGADRVSLKKLLAEMAEEGLLKGRRKRIERSGHLPSVTVVQIVDRDADGEFLAHPSRWDEETEPPHILIVASASNNRHPAGIGDRVLARLSRLEPGDPSGAQYEAQIIKRLPSVATRLLGIFSAQTRGGGVIDPIDKRQMREWRVLERDRNDANTGDLVRFEIEKSRVGRTSVAKIIEVIGNPEAEGAASLIALHSLGLPDEFPQSVMEEAEQVSPPEPGLHQDLTDIAFVTIDPDDARDHDDAVWAGKDDDPGNPGGWVVCVAIADVSWFVRPGSELDREALKRGNSVYFPDRVVPMLPERISNNLCSLVEDEPRSCLCVRMVFDRDGHKKSHAFQRGMMRSRARLSYAQAQTAIDGTPDSKTQPLLDPILKPLWDAYQALAAARDKRAPLNLDLPEQKILLDDDGKVTDIIVPERLEAHRLIEEFMIQANVSAAETLEKHKCPLIYRVHDKPSKEKLLNLKDFLATIDLRLPSTGSLKPASFNRVLMQAEETELGQLVSEVVLRSQSQAEYNTRNFGHFGLNLNRYAHFTSPIRRYADLTVHRALIASLSLGDGGLTDREAASLDETAESISASERLAIQAERQTADRLMAAFLADRIGATFAARVSGVTRSGLFVRLHDTGADGFVPASTIGDDFYRHDEASHALIGDRTGESFRIGDQVDVRLIEAVPSAGALRFEILSEGTYRSRKPAREKSKPPSRRKGKNRAARRRQNRR